MINQNENKKKNKLNFHEIIVTIICHNKKKKKFHITSKIIEKAIKI